MNKALIHDMTLKARSLLVTEISDLLEGIYGLDASITTRLYQRNPCN